MEIIEYDSVSRARVSHVGFKWTIENFSSCFPVPSGSSKWFTTLLDVLRRFIFYVFFNILFTHSVRRLLRFANFMDSPNLRSATFDMMDPPSKWQLQITKPHPSHWEYQFELIPLSKIDGVTKMYALIYLLDPDESGFWAAFSARVLECSAYRVTPNVEICLPLIYLIYLPIKNDSTTFTSKSVVGSSKTKMAATHNSTTCCSNHELLVA
jgi:hypothetical protein